MKPLDRINQLNNEVAILRSQIFDARKQLEADSATIDKLAKDKRELISALYFALERIDGETGLVNSAAITEGRKTLSRHA